MISLKKLLWPALIVLSATSVVLAQSGETCPAIVRTALQNAQTACDSTGRNQACYGNSLLQADVQPGTGDFRFNAVGDIVDAEHIRTLRLSAMDTALSQWGLALMRIQANIPDTNPANVTLLLFGDVQLEHTAADLTTSTLEATTSVNVRRGPSMNSAVVDSIPQGDDVNANGRLADDSWVRVAVPDAIGFGWMDGALLQGDVNALAVVQPAEPVYGPMQAFTFDSGTDDAACAEAPRSGLLVQTPEGVGEVRIVLNQVAIRLGSTVFFEMTSSNAMQVSVLEGHARVTAGGETVFVPAGAQVDIPMSGNAPFAPPDIPHAYDPGEFAAFAPVVAVMPKGDEIAVSDPIPEAQLAYYVSLNHSSHKDEDNSDFNGGGGGGTLVADAGNAVGQAVNNATNGVLGDTVSAVTGTVANTVETVTDTVENTVVAVTDTVNNVAGAVLGDTVGAAVETVTNTVDETVNTVEDTVSTVGDVVSDATNAAGEAVEQVVEDTGDAVDDVLDNVTSPLGNLLHKSGGPLLNRRASTLL